MKHVLVFGVFDELHDGHRSFLKQAKALGEKLTVCLAQSDVVKTLKGKRPKQPLAERKAALEQSGLVDNVMPGDKKIGDYSCVRKLKPDIIAFGYDQDALRNDLETWLVTHKKAIDHTVLKPFKPEVYKSSKLRTTDKYD